MAFIGYSRVSTDDQNSNLQRDALKAAGCDRIFEDFDCSAVSRKRSAFNEALAALKAGDTFIVWNMDRAFRSIRQALDTIDLLRARDVMFRSITESFIDMTSAHGCLVYSIRNVFAQYERELIGERTKAGMEAARRRGTVLGRPRKLSDQKVQKARILLREGKSIRQVAHALHVSIRTLNRALDRS